MVNYFPMSPGDMCDDHITKIGYEITECLADVLHVLAPELEPAPEIGAACRKHRHLHEKTKSGEPGKSHPLILWASGCRANALYLVHHALGIFNEHERRQSLGMGKGTPKPHAARSYAEFLREVLHEVDFDSERAHAWRRQQLGGQFGDSKRYRQEWWSKHGPPLFSVLNVCPRSTPPQIMNAKEFGECLQLETLDHEHAYRLYYAAKVRKGLRMRYYYTEPPPWLVEMLGPDECLLKRAPASRSRKSPPKAKDAPRKVRKPAANKVH